MQRIGIAVIPALSSRGAGHLPPRDAVATPPQHQPVLAGALSAAGEP
jgi:hypothetical protein